MRFEHIDIKNKEKFPSSHLIQWKCLYKLIKEQTSSDKMSSLARIGKCSVPTLSRALRKNLEKDQNIIMPAIARRIAKWYNNMDILCELCPKEKK